MYRVEKPSNLISHEIIHKNNVRKPQDYILFEKIERTKDRAYRLFRNALNSCETEAEKERVKEEISLFEGRGWVEYFSVLEKLISEFRDLSGEMPVYMNKSVLDSYAMYRTRNIFKDNKLLRDEKAKGILFNDALRLDISVYNAEFNKQLLRRNEIIRRPLDEILLESGLNYEILETRRTDLSIEQLIIVSTSDIPKKDIDVILNEKKESSKEETDILRKYLILNFKVRLGI